MPRHELKNKLKTVMKKSEQKEKKPSNVDRFYNWLQMCKNVHLADDEQIVKAFNKIPV